MTGPSQKTSNALREAITYGQSIWYDGLVSEADFARLIRDGEIRGATTNPTIFEKAFAAGEYDAVLAQFGRTHDEQEIYAHVAVEAVRRVCDAFRPLHEESGRKDGFVSIEVSPLLARDTEGTLAEARRLRQAVDRPNVMIKVPATREGLPAVETLIAEGIHVNVTLIFSVERYREVMNAYLAGLERRLAAGQSPAGVASVASFFVSRLDTVIDKRIEDKIRSATDSAVALGKLAGTAGIANSRVAYLEFEKTFASERFRVLKEAGADVQRPLWASTGTKNPAYSDVLYVEALMGPQTVNTVPPATLDAFRDHGSAGARLREKIDEAPAVLAALEAAGISIAQVTRELEEAGVEAFADSYRKILATIASKKKSVAQAPARKAPAPKPAPQLPAIAGASWGAHGKSIALWLDKVEKGGLVARIWAKDPAAWKADPAEQAEIVSRLGWLEAPEAHRELAAEAAAFAAEVKAEGIAHVVLLGMGGSSLAPEVYQSVHARREGWPVLHVLDSTDPGRVRDVEEAVDLSKTLFIFSSKSGGTVEPTSAYRYFRAKLDALLGTEAGRRFVAVTDPGTSLETTARNEGFRRVFAGRPDVGGRFSALTAFGLVPAALIGIDIVKLLERARAFASDCRQTGASNPAVPLGVAMAVLAEEGRDKMTLLAAPGLESFGDWVEQLVAESSGKEELGVVPVVREPLGEPSVYGDDRFFVALKTRKTPADWLAKVEALRAEGHPVLELTLADPSDLGAEYFRWEMATAVACALLKVNAFDQPDVQLAKDKTKSLLARAAKGQPLEFPSSAEPLETFLETLKSGEYVAILAFVPDRDAVRRRLESLQAVIRDLTRNAVTVGIGPRYLHSTGQLHKGGADNGVFLLITRGVDDDLSVPGESYTFGQLERAQALGDYEALRERGRRVYHLELADLTDASLAALAEQAEQAFRAIA